MPTKTKLKKKTSVSDKTIAVGSPMKESNTVPVLEEVSASSQVKPRSKQQRAGIVFPILRLKKYLKKGNYYGVTNRMKTDVPIYLAAVMEYLTAELIELAGDVCKQGKRTTINPRHLQLAIRHDDEINKLLHGVTIASGGVVPGIHPVLLPKKSQNK